MNSAAQTSTQPPANLPHPLPHTEAVKLGRKVIQFYHKTWVGVKTPASHAEIGKAAADLEAVGRQWTPLADVNAVCQSAERVRAKKAELAKTAAKAPTVVEKTNQTERAFAKLQTELEACTEALAREPNEKTNTARTLARKIKALQAQIARGPKVAPTPGQVFTKKGQARVFCRGRDCSSSDLLMEARVTADFKQLMFVLNQHGVKRLEDVTAEHLGTVSFGGACGCAGQIIKSATQSVAEALRMIETERAKRAAEPQPGEFVNETRTEIVCTGQNSRCRTRFSIFEMRVPASERYTMQMVDVQTREDLTDEKLAQACHCPKCAERRFPQGSQTFTQAAMERDLKIAEAIERSQHKATPRKEETPEQKRNAERARRAQNGGSFAREQLQFVEDVPAWMQLSKDGSQQGRRKKNKKGGKGSKRGKGGK